MKAQCIINIIATGPEASGKTRMIEFFKNNLPKWASIKYIEIDPEAIPNQHSLTLIVNINN